MSIVNIVIRTYNEEDWIKFCLQAVLDQDYSNFRITIVDSGSYDRTLDIVRKFPKVEIVHIKEYKPGLAINVGVEAVDSDYFICLSAHCIPTNKNWITKYVSFMNENIEIAGAFGRQLPLSCTQPDDARDLLITFGEDFRVNEKDYFFHNANSIIRNSVWRDIPFDNTVPHVEDRVWAKSVVTSGMKTAYLPYATVYHYHGLHQHGSSRSFRAVNVLSVMHSLEKNEGPKEVYSLVKNNINFPIVILIPSSFNNIEEICNKLNKLICDLKEEVYVVTDQIIPEGEIPKEYYKIINRDLVEGKPNISIRDLIRNILNHIEHVFDVVLDGLAFYDLSYSFISSDMALKCRKLLFNGWGASVLPAWRDFGNYWMLESGDFRNIQSSYNLRKEKPALFRSVLGQGGAVRASYLRSPNENIPVGELIWTDDSSLIMKDKRNA